MKRILIGLFLALVAFFVGASISIFRKSNQSVLDIENPDTVTRCQFVPLYPQIIDSEISLRERQALITGIPTNFDEAPLEILPPCVSEIYRFVLVPNSHFSVAIRVWRSGNEIWLVAKKLDGPNRAYATYGGTRTLSEEDWHKFKSLVDKSSFWNIPKFNQDKPASSNENKWIMDGLKDNKYHNVQLLTPSNEMRAVFRYLLELSEKDLQDEYKSY